jgi:sugar lactone lactonase YvrE
MTFDLTRAPRIAAAPLGGGACELGEGVIWDPRTGGLAWVDILAGRILTAELDGGRLRVTSDERLDVPVGAIAPRAARTGWIAAAGDGIAIVEGARTTWLARPEERHRGRTRMNDAACDAEGRFWAGSMAYDGTPGMGSLYRVDADGTCEQVLDGLTISNGIGWSPDRRTMYLADTGTGRIDAIEFDLATGTLGRRRTLLDLGEEQYGPDGLCVDAGGTIWTALWGGGAVLALRPDGSAAAVVDVGAPQPTSCAIEPGAARMVISSATYQLAGDAARAPSGELWGATVPAAGQPQPCWPG